MIKFFFLNDCITKPDSIARAWKHCLLPWYHLWYSPDIVSTAVRVTSSTTSRPLCQGQRSDVCQARQARSPTLWFSTLCKSVHLVPVKTSDAELMGFCMLYIVALWQKYLLIVLIFSTFLSNHIFQNCDEMHICCCTV